MKSLSIDAAIVFRLTVRPSRWRPPSRLICEHVLPAAMPFLH